MKKLLRLVVLLEVIAFVSLIFFSVFFGQCPDKGWLSVRLMDFAAVLFCFLIVQVLVTLPYEMKGG